MTPDVVVDIGNTRLKWGVCRGGRVTDVLRLPLDEPAAWDAALAKLPPPQAFARQWAVASVNPPALHRFGVWAYPHGGTVAFETHADLPIKLNVDEPNAVGLDRLCGAVAAKAMVPAGTPAITVDVGTAVTVNLIDADGVFQGGAIFPGPRLMARSLHEHTAKLPLVELTGPATDAQPAKSTAAAIRQGIENALIGGVHGAVSLFSGECPVPPWLFITGGGAHLLAGYRANHMPEQRVVPALNLEGIRIAAGGLP
jgi:type III pantothenate kinase